MKEGRVPSATTAEGQPKRRRRTEEEMKETRMVMKRRARRRRRVHGRAERCGRAVTRRHEAGDGHVRKAGEERRVAQRRGKLEQQAWKGRACGHA